MDSLFNPTLVGIYLLGGITFLPLLLSCLLLYGWATLPQASQSPEPSTRSGTWAPSIGDVGEFPNPKTGHDASGPDFAAGYFAVCREYVPGGINGKPPERKTPAGETIATESPSVYQNIYRSMFDRKTQVTGVEGGKSVKRARNIFYVVLRHGHLMLFDTSEQLEVRHVISLALYTVSVRGEGSSIPEGELWIKRNCIQLTRKDSNMDLASHVAPFFFFSDNCSEKEDFYHTLLASQRKLSQSNRHEIPNERKFESEDMIKLIRHLHVSEENIQTRWLNALIGRVFLGLYKTSRLEDLIKAKIRRKISRVPKPTFITSILLQDVTLGNSAPIVINPRLKEMTVDGSLTLEADVKYSGSFRAVIAAVARIDLGQRFKAREVDLVLAGILRKLDGHLLILIKPPPSNRIWFSFEAMPRLELSLEPIVSTRQITYGIILRAIESRIREVIGDTLVLPNWDDIPFTNTAGDPYRGGIWKEDESHDVSTESQLPPGRPRNDLESDDQPISPTDDNMGDISQGSSTTNSEMNTELQPDPIPQSDLSTATSHTESGSSSTKGQASTVIARTPIANDGMRKRNIGLSLDAGSTLRRPSSKSWEDIPSLSQPNAILSPSRHHGGISNVNKDTTADNPSQSIKDLYLERTHSLDHSTADETDTMDNPLLALSTNIEQKQKDLPGATDNASVIHQSLNSATAAAKRWGLGVVQRQTSRSGDQSNPWLLSQPVGRGSPLPPPGQPLPGPQRTWTSSAFNSIKRKSISSPLTSEEAARTPDSLG